MLKKGVLGLNNCKDSVGNNGVEEIQGATLGGSRVRRDEQLILGNIKFERPIDIQIEMLSRELRYRSPESHQHVDHT